MIAEITFDTIRRLPCPNCNEIINTSMQHCPFCSVPIDLKAAEAADELQEKIVRAYWSAGTIRNMAMLIWIFFLVRFIPFIGVVGLLGMLVMIFIVPVKIAIWQIKFGRIKADDPDFKRAKRNKNIALLIWSPLGLFVFWSLINIVLGILFL